MNDYQSIYGEHIRQFIELKRKLGFKYVTAAVSLAQIDQLATQRGEISPGITKAFADQWKEQRPNESAFNRYERTRRLLQLSAYLRDLGINSYLPKLPPYVKSTFIPHIYSSKEMHAIFKALDGLRMQILSKTSGLMCLPALIRLLYATGLRIGEALALKNGAIDLTQHHLLVTDSKNGKERIIPISDSLSSVLANYKQYRDRLPCAPNKSEYFFIQINGQQCTWQGVRYWFKKCLEEAAIPHKGVGRGPRIHDLRHTFAVNALASMAQSGLDLYVSLPILSNYLGHQSLGATDHYVRLTASMYPDLIKDVNMVCLDVFPKFNNYEAD